MKKNIATICVIQFAVGHLLSAGQYVHQTTRRAAPVAAGQMVCFFPSGVYTISDTLSCVQGYYRRQHGKNSAAPNFPCVLVGSQTTRRAPKGREGKARPTIVLAPRSPGFGNPEKPKYLVHFWARSIDNPNQPQPNICFNQMFIGIDVTIGRDNPGATGIRLRGAQGSGVQDCRIDATHGLVGLEGGCGSGGSHAGITITRRAAPVAAGRRKNRNGSPGDSARPHDNWNYFSQPARNSNPLRRQTGPLRRGN